MELPAELEHLPEMLAFIKKRASEEGLSTDKMRKIELASEEALVNIISYAFPQSKQKMLTLDCKANKGRFEVEVRDRGLPFNPIDAEIQVNLNQKIEERKIGGLGIYLIRKLVDEITYYHDGEANILKLAITI